MPSEFSMIASIQKYRLPILFFTISLICYGSFHIIGSEVDKDGYLQEPFALIPLGYIFFFASVVTSVFLKEKTKP